MQVCCPGTKGRGKGVHPRGLWAHALLPWAQTHEFCIQALGAGTSSLVVPPFLSCNLWPLISSLGCPQGGGQGIPSPSTPAP